MKFLINGEGNRVISGKDDGMLGALECFDIGGRPDGFHRLTRSMVDRLAESDAKAAAKAPKAPKKAKRK